jgi:HlyD family secretion protein
VDRWEVQDVRLSREVRRAVVDPQVLTETQHQHRSAVARWEAQKATIAKADAELLAKRASLEAAIVDVAVDRARVAVAASEAKRLEAWVGYLKLFAPYDGIVVERNVNTWDFVLPQTGDPTAMIRSPHLSPSGQAAPVYVIDRTDIVRIYVDVPERDADYVHIGSEARVKIWAYRDEWMPASVTRISWALNPKSRTMRAEIDLPNPNSKILPGMYAYGKIIVDRPDIRVLPRTAVTHAGGKSFVWLYEDGRAQRTEIRTGLQEGKWIEVITRRLKTESEDEDKWEPFNGSEHVLMGHKISTLTEGTHVEISDAPAPIEGVSDSEKDNSM